MGEKGQKTVANNKKAYHDYFIEETGFSSRYRNNTNIKITIRKYLYILYSISIVFPMFDSIYLSLKYKSITMLLHCIYVYYVTFNIFIYYILKLLGIEVKNSVYGR